MAEMRCGMWNQGMNPGMRPPAGQYAGPGMNPDARPSAGACAGPGMKPGARPSAGSGMSRGMNLGTDLSMGQMENQSAGQSRQALMKQINEASFAMDDVLLFLDTHPDNAEAMQYYRNAVSMRKNAMDAYQKQFGPLLVDDVTGNNWSWVTEKWPWEGGY